MAIVKLTYYGCKKTERMERTTNYTKHTNEFLSFDRKLLRGGVLRAAQDESCATWYFLSGLGVSEQESQRLRDLPDAPLSESA
jgi:hypothetical protein